MRQCPDGYGTPYRLPLLIALLDPGKGSTGAARYSSARMPFLEARDLSKTYRGAAVPVLVFADLDIAVQRGEMLAIVGPSGIGKSTLLHLLGGLDRPDSGTIRVDNADVTAMSNDELARFRNRNVGFVFQFLYLLPELSTTEYVVMQ